MDTRPNINTRKTEVNNEIVLLRKFVRQARVCVSRKLFHEAKLLRAKRGSEKQCEKNTNKADKLINQVFALKKIKDDDISIFGIMNIRSLETLLQDSSSDIRTQILAKMIRFKNLHSKIMEFREKFPDYENVCKRRQKRRSTRKRIAIIHEEPNVTHRMSAGACAQADKKPKALGNNKANVPNDDKNNLSLHSDEGNDVDSDGSHDHDDESENEDDRKRTNVFLKKEERKERSSNVSISVRSMAKKNVHSTRKKNNKRMHREATELSAKAVSGIATVKRFAELLVSEESPKESAGHGETTQLFSTDSLDTNEEAIKKESDDFFMTSDGNNVYLSVAVAKRNEDTQQIEDNRMNDKWTHVERRPWHYLEKERKLTQGEEVTTRASFTEKDRGPLARSNLIDKMYRDVSSDNMRRRNSTDKDNTESLHPSWEARRKQQEMMKRGFQGKKIVFDDV